ncbi:hypothetical protein GCM10009085_35860 [Pseudomonas avellanae]|nr:hypothetical protein GCM10009085_35860 [Pseudomonas avellanae]
MTADRLATVEKRVPALVFETGKAYHRRLAGPTWTDVRLFAKYFNNHPRG